MSYLTNAAPISGSLIDSLPVFLLQKTLQSAYSLPKPGSLTIAQVPGTTASLLLSTYAVSFCVFDASGALTAEGSASYEKVSGSGHRSISLPVSSDVRITARRIYRYDSKAEAAKTRGISDGDTSYFYLVKTIYDNTTTTWIDTGVPSSDIVYRERSGIAFAGAGQDAYCPVNRISGVSTVFTSITASTSYAVPTNKIALVTSLCPLTAPTATYIQPEVTISASPYKFWYATAIDQPAIMLLPLPLPAGSSIAVSSSYPGTVSLSAILTDNVVGLSPVYQGSASGSASYTVPSGSSYLLTHVGCSPTASYPYITAVGKRVLQPYAAGWLWSGARLPLLSVPILFASGTAIATSGANVFYCGWLIDNGLL